MHSVQGIRFWENIGQNSYGIYAVYIELMQFHLPQGGEQCTISANVPGLRIDHSWIPYTSV